ncbi:MAG: hypothetical protein IJS88_00375 [Alphaproteobacteria bacterium]|nr:hypothetical protein [Alphaproteobacteria bacterium]
MKKIAFILGLFSVFSMPALSSEQISSDWNSVWEYQRYATGISGALEINNCIDNQCDFSISTANGAHLCSLEGKLEIKANKGEYKNRIETPEGKYEDVVVTFTFDADKNAIDVEANSLSRIYCGMQGNFIGSYENKNNPLRYDTGFDCWAKNLTDTEQTICASEKLARASKETIKNYSSLQTTEWYNRRANCHTDEKCIWEFYISTIKSGYKEQGKQLNLYEYMGNLSEDELYYPMDFSLLTDFLIRNMENNDYNEFVSNFAQISLADNKCDKCHYHTYGLPGLYTITESAFYIDQDEIWVAFLHSDYANPQDEYIVIYALPDKEEKDIPAVFNTWLDRLKPQFPNGIKLKFFTKDKKISE